MTPWPNERTSSYSTLRSSEWRINRANPTPVLEDGVLESEACLSLPKVTNEDTFLDCGFIRSHDSHQSALSYSYGAVFCAGDEALGSRNGVMELERVCNRVRHLEARSTQRHITY